MTREPAVQTNALVEEASDDRTFRILVAEDDWLIAMEIEATLEEAGFIVVGTAVTSAEAIAMAELHNPHVVLMDIRLQGDGDGIDAAREIYARFGTRSLFISANNDQKTRERADMSNPIGWLPKPFSNTQLVGSLRRAIGMPD